MGGVIKEQIMDRHKGTKVTERLFRLPGEPGKVTGFRCNHVVIPSVNKKTRRCFAGFSCRRSFIAIISIQTPFGVEGAASVHIYPITSR
jgi:hypothetical protein